MSGAVTRAKCSAGKSFGCSSQCCPSGLNSVTTPLKFSVPISQAYTSVSFYTRSDIAYYAINDRAAGRRVIELDLMTPDQHNDLPDNEEITAADRLIVESPTHTGLIVIKALAAEPGLLASAQNLLTSAKCQPQPQ